MNFDEKIELDKKRVQQWHDGVKYGNDMSMSDQLLGTSQKIEQFYNGKNKEDVVIASLLYKAIERKSLNSQTKEELKKSGYYDEKKDFLVKAYNSSEIMDARNDKTALSFDFSPKVVHILEDIFSEPEDDKNASKEAVWQKKAIWATTLSPEAQVILLAEKLQNFEVSYKNPNPEWTAERHIAYYKTRMLLVEAIKEACPEMYQECVKLAKLGIARSQTA